MEQFIIDRERACFFTGHRYLPAIALDAIKAKIREKAINLIEAKGVDTFITGGALGFDTIAALEILRLKKTYDDIRLCLYLPCYNQASRWNSANRRVWGDILEAADYHIFVTHDNFSPDCMHKRNRKMAEDALYCIAYCERAVSGTGKTLAYAYDLNDVIENIF